MADLRVELNDVVVHLSVPESVVACRRALRVPVSQVRMVHVEDDPLRGISVVFPGLCWPGSFAVGTYKRDRRREFAAVHAGCAAVVLDIEGGDWDRVLVSVPGAVEVAAELAAVLLGRSPGGAGRRSGTLPTAPQD